MKWNQKNINVIQSDSKQMVIKNETSHCVVANALCEATKWTAALEVGIIYSYLIDTYFWLAEKIHFTAQVAWMKNNSCLTFTWCEVLFILTLWGNFEFLCHELTDCSFATCNQVGLCPSKTNNNEQANKPKTTEIIEGEFACY